MLGCSSRSQSATTVILLAGCFAQQAGAQDDTQQEILRRLDKLESEIVTMQSELRARDARIRELEEELRSTAVSPSTTESPQEQPALVVTAPAAGAPAAAPITPPQQNPESARPALVSLDDASEPGEQPYYGLFQSGGRGIRLADTPWGTVNFSAWTYARYLNQKELDPTYTDAFGRTFDLNLQNNMQLNKVNLYMKGWVYDPRLRYLLYVWTSNSNGPGNQTVVAGNINYHFNDAFDVGVGINALPGTRTLIGTFPYWLKVDTRPMADEYFRPSYTSGIWSTGDIAPGLKYKVMLGNNLSQLGVSANRLDGSFNTLSGAVWWMPTTGEFGPAGGFGDFENHEELATTLGLHVTRSREDAQSQPGVDDIQNSQIRLSDGTIIFTRDAFNTGGSINRATYLMSSIDAGMKYRGYSLEGEYYFRWVDDFATVGNVPVGSLFDNGFQVQASAMLIPKTLQPYVAASKIFGEYGDPWDFAVGLNWFPLQQRLFRLNTELLYLKDSPVGYSSVPFVVGGNGWVFYSNLELMF